MRARIAILTIVVLAAFTGVTPARADENGPPGLWTNPSVAVPDEPEPREKIFYGWQLIPVDMASVALMTLGSGNVRKAGIGAYLTSGLLFHTLRGNADHGARSLFLRGGLPVLGWAVGGVVGGLSTSDPGCFDEMCENDWIRWDAIFDGEAATAGVVAGVGLALAIDWIKLSWMETPSSTERSILAPQVIIDEQGLSMGVLGSF